MKQKWIQLQRDKPTIVRFQHHHPQFDLTAIYRTLHLTQVLLKGRGHVPGQPIVWAKTSLHAVRKVVRKSS